VAFSGVLPDRRQVLPFASQVLDLLGPCVWEADHHFLVGPEEEALYPPPSC